VLFRRLLAVFRSPKVDLKMVLTYELTVVPPSLFKDDSSMRKTAKADLQKKLEENSQSLPELLVLPQTASDQPTSAYIIDDMEMLQSLNENQFRTFDDLAVVVQKKLVRILKNASLDVTSVTVVFDRYDVETSVEGSERQRRGTLLTAGTHQIKGGRQVPNYRQCLKVLVTRLAGQTSSQNTYFSMQVSSCRMGNPSF